MNCLPDELADQRRGVILGLTLDKGPGFRLCGRSLVGRGDEYVDHWEARSGR
jgi:hypothetical protein